MQCPKCDFEQADQNATCPKCGVIFDTYLKRVKNGPPPVHLSRKKSASKHSKWEFIKILCFSVKPETNLLVFGGWVLFFFIILIWSLKFFSNPLGTHYALDSFWHLVNLPFHEAGHLIFRPLGIFMTSIGGSLSQLLMPVVCFAVFLLKTRDSFASSFALWWFGENFIDLAPYINDARSLTLPLVGGNTGRTSPYGFHDWEFILKEAGMDKYDHILAQMAEKLGSLLMFCALVWSAYLLYKQYKHMKFRSSP
jgi:hypothetical protein